MLLVDWREIDDDFFGRDFDNFAVLPDDEGDAELLVLEAGLAAGLTDCGGDALGVSKILVNSRRF